MSRHSLIALFTLALLSVTVSAFAAQTGAEALARWDKDMDKARATDAPWIAPKAFDLAERALLYAREQQRNRVDDTQLLDSVNAGRSEMARALSVVDATEIEFTELLARRAGAREEIAVAKAAKLPALTPLEKEMTEREKALHELAQEVEAGEAKNLKARKEELTKAFAGLEVRGLKKNVLDPARQKIDAAKKRAAAKIVPQALGKAETALAEAERFIAANPQARDKARTKGNEALFQANRLTNFIDFTDTLKKKRPEELALWLETKLGASQELAVIEDDRDKTFEQQFVSLRDGIQALREGRGKNQGKAAEADALRAMGATDRKYEEIRTLFDPEEAEVLRDGGRLIVRLRALSFPVGKAEVLPQSQPLLARVKKAIERYGDSWLVVEGHTDSSGSNESNEKLSLDRAQAVRNYLVEQRAVPEDRVRVHGYGSQRPVASNKTEGGRALNRRIDVVFELDEKTFARLGDNEGRGPASR